MIVKTKQDICRVNILNLFGNDLQNHLISNRTRAEAFAGLGRFMFDLYFAIPHQPIRVCFCCRCCICSCYHADVAVAVAVIFAVFVVLLPLLWMLPLLVQLLVLLLLVLPLLLCLMLMMLLVQLRQNRISEACFIDEPLICIKTVRKA